MSLSTLLNIEAVQQAYAAATLAEGGPALVHAPKLESWFGPRHRLYLTARHATAVQILSDDQIFSLRHYDELLEAVADPVRFILGVDTPDRQKRLAMLAAAQAHARQLVPDGRPLSNAAYLDWIGETVQREANGALEILLRKQGTMPTINLVREYAFLVTYRTAVQVFGVYGPRRPPLLAWLFMLFRNLAANGEKLPLRGELGSAMAVTSLFHFVFGYLFAPPVATPLLRLPAGWAASGWTRIVHHALDDPKSAPAGSLLKGLHATRGQFTELTHEEWRDHATSILFELVSAMVLLVTRVFSDMAGKLAGPQRSRSTPTLPRLSDALRGLRSDPAALLIPLDEALRFAGGTRLMRCVEQAVELDGIALVPGDRIMVMADVAGNDPRAFPDPGEYRADRPDRHLTFGPRSGPHACYGQFVARRMIAEMLLALEDVLEPVHGAGLTAFAGLPDDFPWRAVDRDDRGQASERLAVLPEELK